MTMTAEKFAEIQADYFKAKEVLRLTQALEGVRARLPSLERRVDQHKTRIAELEEHHAELLKMREAFVKELEGLPQDTRHLTAQEEDRIRSRRQDLRSAIAALDGDTAQGTLVDHLWNQPRIPRTRNLIAEEQELLARAEGDLADARRQL